MTRFASPRLHINVMLVAILALFLPTACVWAQEEQEQGQQQEQADAGTMTAVEVVERVAPAVVTVINQQTISNGIFGDLQEEVQVGAGTGFIIDPEGHIVTNWHVATGGESFLVILADGTEVEAELIGEDPRNDLAVIKIDPEEVPGIVRFGDSTTLEPGQTVLAIGSPLGAFGNTVTRGIVSALNRDQFGVPGLCRNYSDLIQHDAAINPGNSGGPLFNLEGEVIGVNTLGIPSQRGVPVQGLFFAVPSITVIDVAQQIIEQGFISSPFIGINFLSLDPRISAANDLPVDFGVYIRQVSPGTPAEEAGLQADDIIVALNGNEITPEQTFSSMLLDFEPGDTVELTVLRQGQEETVSLTFGEVPQELFEEECTLQNRP